MQHPGFFHRAGPFSLRYVVTAVGAELIHDSAGSRKIDDLRPLREALPTHLTFLANRKYADQLAETRAAACFLTHRHASQLPAGTIAIVTDEPHRTFALALRLFYSDALYTKAAVSTSDADGRLIHSTAQIAQGAVVEAGAVVGREARIGAGTTVAAGAVIGYRVTVGGNCYIGPGATVTHALVGDHVIIHAGARIGQDGFGFAMGAAGHLKLPQIGRVIVGDEVEIGANSTVDRGSLMDTVIGEGTKIDNLVQIAHSVVIGRHCIIVAQSGIAGSAELGDFVVMGARSGVLGHVKIGNGAQIAGMAHVKNDIGVGACVGGTPARPFKQWAREVAAMKRLGEKGPTSTPVDGLAFKNNKT